MSRSKKGKRSGAARAGAGTRKASTPLHSADDAAEALFPTAARVEASPRRERRVTLRRVLLSIGAVAVLLILAGAGYAYWSVQRTMPTISGTVQFGGLSAPVTVTRDTYGVPHILAESVDDLYAAQGYVHAQDRLFQMFLLRAVGQARLSEAFGSPALDADRFFRTVGFKRAAERELVELRESAPEVVGALEAYARGVNEFVRTHRDTMPLEFGLAGLTFEEWQAVDSLTFGKLQAWDLNESWNKDLLAADLAAKLGPETAAKLLPLYPEDAEVIVPGEGGGVSPLLKAYNERVRPWLPNMGADGLGSNNWVVDGTKSVTGKPLLANDPHLGVRNPSVWYQVHLATRDGKQDAVGFSFAGVPGIITGHNRDIAWGVTNVGADVQDLFLEEIDDVNPGNYKSGDSWVPMEIVTETIKVKGGETVTHTVRSTKHGPLLSDAVVMTPTIGVSVQRPFALRWTGLEAGGVFRAVYDLQTAANWEDFREALRYWSAPGQNFVYADTEGNIGYQMTGLMPLREGGNGSVPVESANGEGIWTGYVPFDDLPSAYNPPQHYIATANNKPFGESYPHAIQGDWAAPWRIERITELLEAREKVSADDFKAMQSDTVSPLARKIAPLLGELEPESERSKQAIALVGEWDGNLAVDSVEASIYSVWYQSVLSQTLSDDLGDDLYVQYLDLRGNGAMRALEELIEVPDDPLWDRSDTLEVETRDDIFLRSLDRAVEDLAAGLGDNMLQWTWGKIHTIMPSHPFGSQAVVGEIFNLDRAAIGGDGTTIAVATYPLVAPFTVSNHQSYKMILDAGDWARSLAVFANGQSGQPFSKHFGDMYPLWQRGEYNPLLYTGGGLDAATEAVLTLTP